MIPENASNLFHLSRLEAVSFANLKAFVPGLPFCRDFFLQRHRFHPFPIFFRRSYTWWNWLVFEDHCEHRLASSRVSQRSAVGADLRFAICLRWAYDRQQSIR